MRALAAANQFILDKPGEALELLKKRFDKMDPAVLTAAWQVVSKAHAKDIKVAIAGLENSQKVSTRGEAAGDEGHAHEFRRAAYGGIFEVTRGSQTLLLGAK